MGPEQLVDSPDKTLTLTAVLDTVQLKKALTDGTTATILTLNGGKLVDGVMTPNNFNIHVGVNGGKLDGAYDYPGKELTWGNDLKLNLSNDVWYGAAGTALTLINSTSSQDGTIAVLSIVYHDGTIKHYDGGNGGLKFTDPLRSYIGYQYESDYINYNDGPISDFSEGYALKSDAIAAAHKLNTNKISHLAPEPTTATLSLLALAGLAARRRRK